MLELALSPASATDADPVFQKYPCFARKNPLFQIVSDFGAKNTNNKTSQHQMAFTLTMQRGFIVFAEEAPAITASPMMAGVRKMGETIPGAT
ncbi:MAG: hypothetical protein J6A47_05875 [Bacilli bacterium]|nr:hypothetical protein [Bacilli bacterium]